MHQDARYAQNRELRIEVNVLIIRATSCTLRGINKKRPSHHECDGRLIYFFNTTSCSAPDNYALGPAAISALPSAFVAYFSKFFTKRPARSFAFASHCALSA